MKLINYEEFKRLLLEERDKIPLTVPCALYELRKEKPYYQGQYMKHGIRLALRCLERCQNIATDIEQPQWISCEERLPDVDGNYLICSDRKNVYTSHFYTEKTFLDGRTRKASWSKRGIARVTHWMPLPQPPKGDE